MERKNKKEMKSNFEIPEGVCSILLISNIY